MIKQGDSIINTRTGQKMTFLKTWAETNGTQLKIDCVSPVTSEREESHFHPYQENRFTIVEGQLLFTIDGKDKLATVGDIISIPKMCPTAFIILGKKMLIMCKSFFPH